MGRIDAGFAGPINKDRRIRFLCGVVSHRTRKRPICHALVSDKLDQLPEEVCSMWRSVWSARWRSSACDFGFRILRPH